MLLPVNLRQLQPFLPHMLLHRRIHSQLLADRVARKRPCELISPLGLVFEGCGGLDVLGEGLDGFVVIADCFGDCEGGHCIRLLWKGDGICGGGSRGWKRLIDNGKELTIGLDFSI